MKIVISKRIEADVWISLLGVEVLEKRPDLQYLLKNVENLDLEKPDKQRVIGYLTRLGLYDGRITEDGQRLVENGDMWVKEYGLFRLSISPRCFPGGNVFLIGIERLINKDNPYESGTARVELAEELIDKELKTLREGEKLRNMFYDVLGKRYPEGAFQNTFNYNLILTYDQEWHASLKGIESVIEEEKLFGTIGKVTINIANIMSSLDLNWSDSKDAVILDFPSAKRYNSINSFKIDSINMTDRNLKINGMEDDGWNVTINNVPVIPKDDYEAEQWFLELIRNDMTNINEAFGTDDLRYKMKQKFGETVIGKSNPVIIERLDKIVKDFISNNQINLKVQMVDDINIIDCGPSEQTKSWKIPENRWKVPRIIVDGSNVTGMKGKSRELEKLIRAVESLKKEGFKTIVVIVDSGYHHGLSKEDKKRFDKMLNEGKIFQAPARSDISQDNPDDWFIVTRAMKDDAYILTNDKYSWAEADMKSFVNNRRVTFMEEKGEYIFKPPQEVLK